MDEGLLSLRWNDHSETFFSMLSTIRKNETFCDVTLACDGRFYPAHKFVLSTCSEFFDQIFEKTSCKHPVIVIANIAYKDLEALLNYMYLGEVNVLRTDLKGLVKAAELLRIKGLAEHTKGSNGKESREKRGLSWDSDVPDSKRRKPEESTRTEPDRVTNAKEAPIRPKQSNSQIKGPTVISPEVTYSDGAVEDGEPDIANASLDSRKSDCSSSHDVEDTSLRPEVKMEEVNVKEEPGGAAAWYQESEGDKYQYGDPDGSLAYEPQHGAFQGGVLPWDLASAQIQAMEGHLGLAGPSGLQGFQVPDRGSVYYSEEYQDRFRKHEATKRHYEATKRTRNFCDRWQLEFNWVYYDQKAKAMTCTTCVKYGCQDDKKTRFISGNTNFKRLALVRHERSQTHRTCEARKEADLAPQVAPIELPVENEINFA